MREGVFKLGIVAVVSMSFVGLLSITSCDKAAIEATEEVSLKPEWDWKKYQRSRELLLGTKKVSVQPKRSLEIKSESSGILSLIEDKDNIYVNKGFKWATMNVEKLKTEKEKNGIRERAHKLGKKKKVELDDPEKLKSAKAKLKESRDKVELMKRIMNSKRLRRNSKELFPNIGDISKRSLKEAEQELAFAEKKLLMIQEIDAILDIDEERINELKNEAANKAFEENMKLSNYEIPFSGEMRLELDYVNGEKEYSVTARQVIATLNDYSEMNILLGIAGESWVSSTEAESLTLELTDKEKTRIAFREKKTVKNLKTRREEKNYIFAAISEKHPHLKDLSGTTMQAKLLVKLKERCWIVPKVDVAMEALGQTNSKIWADMVDDVWPGAKVLAEGKNSLAIDYQPPAKPGVNGNTTTKAEVVK